MTGIGGWTSPTCTCNSEAEKVHADPALYLRPVIDSLKTHWPDNRAVNIVCHGHSVPAGYFATPRVDSLNAYPHLLRVALAERFPYSVINVIVSAIGGESSDAGAERFERHVLAHRPNVVTIDYGLNDRHIGLQPALQSWESMIVAAKKAAVGVLLLTPTPDLTQQADAPDEERQPLLDHAEQIRQLASTHQVGLVDNQIAADAYCRYTGELSDLLSWSNHPNRAGHVVVARALMRWFMPA